MGFGGHMGMGYGWIGGLVWLVILGGLVWLVISAIQRNSGSSLSLPLTTREKTPDAVEILKKRFARGEIDAEEYREKLRLLES